MFSSPYRSLYTAVETVAEFSGDAFVFEELVSFVAGNEEVSPWAVWVPNIFLFYSAVIVANTMAHFVEKKRLECRDTGLCGGLSRENIKEFALIGGSFGMLAEVGSASFAAWAFGSPPVTGITAAICGAAHAYGNYALHTASEHTHIQADADHHQGGDCGHDHHHASWQELWNYFKTGGSREGQPACSRVLVRCLMLSIFVGHFFQGFLGGCAFASQIWSSRTMKGIAGVVIGGIVAWFEGRTEAFSIANRLSETEKALFSLNSVGQAALVHGLLPAVGALMFINLFDHQLDFGWRLACAILSMVLFVPANSLGYYTMNQNHLDIYDGSATALTKGCSALFSRAYDTIVGEGDWVTPALKEAGESEYEERLNQATRFLDELSARRLP